MARTDFRNTFLDQMADALIERIVERAGVRTSRTSTSTTSTSTNGTSTNGSRGRGTSLMRGKHFSAAKMRCRWPGGSRNRSLGPKNHWLCAEHLPKWSPKVKAAMAEAKG